MKFAVFISFLAGISTVLGSLILFFKFNSKDKIIACSLAFASGVMVSVSLFDLIPSSITGLNKMFQLFPSIIIGLIFIIIGIILSLSINKYLPDFNNKKEGKLYKLGIFSMIAIILHNVPEGIATFLTTSENTKLGISLALAIALHNIPEGISISIPIYFSTNSKFKAILYTFISGISEFLGAIIAFSFFSSISSTIFLDVLYSLIAGIMISLSLDELFPNSFRYGNKINSFFYLLIGFFFMLLVHFFI